jgi:hypothetical protein
MVAIKRAIEPYERQKARQRQESTILQKGPKSLTIHTFLYNPEKFLNYNINATS